MLSSIDSLTVVELENQLNAASQMNLSGSLGIQNKHGVWQEVCFHMGRLVWATGKHHRMRRWLRCIEQSCPQVKQDVMQVKYRGEISHWEYLILRTLVERQQITRTQAIILIESLITEILFDILQDAQQGEFNYRVTPQKIWDAPINVLNLEPTLRRAERLVVDWFDLELAPYSPNLAPFITVVDELQHRMPSSTFQVMANALNGSLTIRDLALQKRKDLIATGRLLAPYINSQLIGLKEIADLQLSTTSIKPIPKTISRPHTAKIVCIDDSLQICKIVGDILIQAGYEYVSVQDSVQSLPALLEHRPHLILLDLVMPVANGYEICAQIRRISIFKQTPVIILTGNDGIVDRVRAKMVGASDFLVKPVQTNKLLSVVQKYVTVQSEPSIQHPEP